MDFPCYSDYYGKIMTFIIFCIILFYIVRWQVKESIGDKLARLSLPKRCFINGAVLGLIIMGVIMLGGILASLAPVIFAPYLPYYGKLLNILFWGQFPIICGVIGYLYGLYRKKEES